MYIGILIRRMGCWATLQYHYDKELKGIVLVNIWASIVGLFKGSSRIRVEGFRVEATIFGSSKVKGSIATHGSTRAPSWLLGFRISDVGFM